MKHLRTFESFWGEEASGVLPISKSTGRILIGLRSKYVMEPFTWGNFGGAIGKRHGGEEEEKLSPEDNAISEFREESGYDGNIELIPSYVFESGSFKYYNFLGLVDEEFEANTKKHMIDGYYYEVERCEWVTLDELINHEDLHFGIQALLNNNMSQMRTVIENLK